MMTTKKAQRGLHGAKSPLPSLTRQEMALAAGIATCLVFVLGGERTLPLFTNPRCC
jgi:hypothetical protein